MPPRLIRHTLVGHGRNVYEFQDANRDVMFEEGMVDGWSIEENYSGCTLYKFSIYAFDPTGKIANQIFVNGELFQRFQTNFTDALSQMFWPLGYTKDEAAELFAAADMVLVEYSRLLFEKTNKVIYHTDKHGPYDLLASKMVAMEPHCKRYDEKLTSEILKRFSP